MSSRVRFGVWCYDSIQRSEIRLSQQRRVQLSLKAENEQGGSWVTPVLFSSR